MRTIGAVILASSLIVSGAFAATDANAPLAPGKPAGVKQAQAMDNTLLLVLGLGVVAGGIALVASGNGHSTPSTDYHNYDRAVKFPAINRSSKSGRAALSFCLSRWPQSFDLNLFPLLGPDSVECSAK